MAERILVVDDKPQNHRLIEALLAPYGYAISSAASGEEAIRIVASDPPDLMLLDVVMPGMSGYEVCRWVRANDPTRVLPIVMVTANPDQDKVAAIDAGADDFVVEPFERHELLARVRSLLRIKSFNDTIAAQAVELARLNRTLEDRVAAQVSEILGLRAPGRELHVLDLVAAQPADDDSARPPGGDAGSILDPEAKAQYRARLDELDEELRDAERANDRERAARATNERDAVAHELAAAVGLGGRDRKAASDAERARVNVTRAIKAALDRIGEHSPALGRHLEATLRTGQFCSYVPDPRVLVRWEL